MTQNTDEPIEDLFAFYALGTLSADERERVESYIAENPEAEERLREMIQTASALAFIDDPIEPREGVLAGVLERVRPGGPTARKEERAGVAGRGFLNWLRRERASAAIALASLLIATASAAWATASNARMVDQRAKLVGLEQAIAEQEQVLSLINMAGVKAVELPATAEGSPAGGRFFADPQASSGVLLLWGLAPPSPTETYQVWLIAGEEPVSAGLLPIQDQTRSVHLLEASSSLRSFDAIGVSIEPVGGSDLPTGPVVLFAQLPY